jgi:WD40 repeat protein
MLTLSMRGHVRVEPAGDRGRHSPSFLLQGEEGEWWASRSAIFSPCGQWILTVGGLRLSEAALWCSNSGRCLKLMKEHRVAFADFLLSLENGAAEVWLTLGQRLHVLGGGSDLNRLRVASGSNWSRLSADGDEVLSKHPDGTVRVWSISSGECLRVLQAHSSRCDVAEFLPGDRIVTVSSGCSAKLWSSTSGECLCVQEVDIKADVFFQGHAADGEYILLQCRDRSAVVLSPSCCLLRQLTGHFAAISSGTERDQPQKPDVLQVRLWDA